ncbi:MAG: hypothetical protein M1537_08480 [Nitrospirae bacterium]|nr:MAG: hypothetical protein D084_Lepto4C00544G0007 [Leptospirillum sp. Group IV 'UBA BS']MCL4486339.1 hypothetical protein [Nitrospirota bacterium]
MRSDDVLLAGHRPDGSDGLKVRYYPEDGHIRVSFLGKNGHELHGFELSGIEDLESLTDTLARAVLRYRELQGNPHDSYLANVRRILAPQTETAETALMNARP